MALESADARNIAPICWSLLESILFEVSDWTLPRSPKTRFAMGRRGFAGMFYL